MTQEDRDLRALMRHAHEGDPPPPDFAHMIREAAGAPSQPAPTHRPAPLAFALAALVLLGLGALLWIGPETTTSPHNLPDPSSPTLTPTLAQHPPKATPEVAPTLDLNFEEVLSWEAPTDYLLALGEDDDGIDGLDGLDEDDAMLPGEFDDSMFPM